MKQSHGPYPQKGGAWSRIPSDCTAAEKPELSLPYQSQAQSTTLTAPCLTTAPDGPSTGFSIPPYLRWSLLEMLLPIYPIAKGYHIKETFHVQTQTHLHFLLGLPERECAGNRTILYIQELK